MDQSNPSDRRMSARIAAQPNKRMQLTKLRAAPERRDKVPPCAPAGRTDGGTASQLIRSVLRTNGGLMKATRATVVLPLMALLLAPGPTAQACVCSESSGLEADYREAEAVFAGKVVALQIATVEIAGQVDEQMVATLRVERRWKGPRGAEIRVRTCGTQEMLCTCGTDFELGAHFVVFAVGKPLSTGSCQRTRRYQRVPGEARFQWVGAEDLVRDLDALEKASQ
jgi:hypothetical protein